MPRRPRYTGGAAKLDSIVDGVEFLSAEQVATQSGQTTDLVYLHVRQGLLCPGKIGSQYVFTRADVQRWRQLRSEHAITTELEKGAHPVDVYLQGEGRWKLDDVTATMHRWARLTGAWVIEGPRGSYARWLQRLGLIRVTPRQLRRVIELLLADPHVQQRAQLALGAVPEPSGRPRLVPVREEPSPEPEPSGPEEATDASFAEGGFSADTG